jgi:glycosyltransferase involved in cell wall biosynthesis
MLGFLLATLIPALKLIRAWRPDIIHVHFAVPTGVLGRVLSKVCRIPYLLTAHLGDVPGGVPEKTDRWFRYVFPFTKGIWRDAANVVAVSDYTRDLALKHYEVPIQVIPNGVRIPREAFEQRDVQVGNPVRIIFAGRFQPQKNLICLVKSLAQVKDLSWECSLYGDGPQREMIEAEIEKVELADRVHLPGWVHTEVVWEKLGESDLLAMPSLSEGLPVVGVHALGRGLAIVANRAGGLIDLVDDGVNGRLCQIGDQTCFEEALRWCLEDKVRLKSLKKASLLKSQSFDIDNIAQTYERLFMKVTKLE